MTSIELSIIILLTMGSFINSLYCAVFLQVLNFKLAKTILFIEFRSLLQPKIKIVTFLIMMNVDIKEELRLIVGKSDKRLLEEYRDLYKNENITLTDIKKIKKNATTLLNKSKSEKLISYSEVKTILKNEGILSFFSSLKRSVRRYSSFEQQERYIDSDEVNAIWSLLTNKSKYSSKKNKEKYLNDSLEPLRKKYADFYVTKKLLSTVVN